LGDKQTFYAGIVAKLFAVQRQPETGGWHVAKIATAHANIEPFGLLGEAGKLTHFHRAQFNIAHFAQRFFGIAQCHAGEDAVGGAAGGRWGFQPCDLLRAVVEQGEHFNFLRQGNQGDFARFGIGFAADLSLRQGALHLRRRLPKLDACDAVGRDGAGGGD
jgi:hypothetical protein